jgi:hypothetical protein
MRTDELAAVVDHAGQPAFALQPLQQRQQLAHLQPKLRRHSFQTAHLLPLVSFVSETELVIRSTLSSATSSGSRASIAFVSCIGRQTPPPRLQDAYLRAGALLLDGHRAAPLLVLLLALLLQRCLPRGSLGHSAFLNGLFLLAAPLSLNSLFFFLLSSVLKALLAGFVLSRSHGATVFLHLLLLGVLLTLTLPIIACRAPGNGGIDVFFILTRFRLFSNCCGNRGLRRRRRQSFVFRRGPRAPLHALQSAPHLTRLSVLQFINFLFLFLLLLSSLRLCQVPHQAAEMSSEGAPGETNPQEPSKNTNARLATIAHAAIGMATVAFGGGCPIG